MKSPYGWTPLPQEDSTGNAFYQVSLITALAGGIYDGSVTAKELLLHGDFGLGTFSSLDGEMVGLDGQFYHLRSDGRAELVTGNETTPFAAVTHFRPHFRLEVKSPLSKKEAYRTIQTAAEQNLITAIRAQGEFAQVSTRTVSKQTPPYSPLIEAASHEATRTLRNVSGALAGFLTPAVFGGLNVEGFHLHFLSSDKASGGHCLDFTLQEGMIDISFLSRLTLDLPTSGPFLTADLIAPDLTKAIKTAEG